MKQNEDPTWPPYLFNLDAWEFGQNSPIKGFIWQDEVVAK